MNVALTDARGIIHREAALSGGWMPDGETPPLSVNREVERARLAWWLWPHMLSLDAPLVALVWQRWWARSTGTPLPISREVILGLGVWLIYLTDRLADTMGDRRVCGAPRHTFSARRRNLLLPLAAAIALALISVVVAVLPTPEFLAGLGLLALTFGHFCLTHGWPGRGWAAYVPKEAVVGAMFSVGSGFFVACRSPHLERDFWFGMVLFAGVCFLNCALITRWERHAEDLCERSSLLNAFPRFCARLSLVCGLLAGLALAGRSVIGVPAACSAVLLAVLDHHKNRLSVEALRVLADIVLLTPCLLLWR